MCPEMAHFQIKSHLRIDPCQTPNRLLSAFMKTQGQFLTTTVNGCSQPPTQFLAGSQS